MTLQLSPLLDAFVTAHNRHEGVAFTTCFSADAIVHDEGKTHRGQAAIRGWFEDISHKYGATITVTGVEIRGDETLLTAQVAGNFEGSPIELLYCLNIADDNIRALSIGG